MEGRPPVSNAGEDVSAVHKKRAPCRLNSPARISRSSGFFVPQSPSESVLTVDQAPNTKARRAVAVQLPQASPRTLDGYVEIEGSDTVLNVLREAQGESGLRFQERFGGGHTEVVSFQTVLQLKNRPYSLKSFEEDQISDSSEQSSDMVTLPKGQSTRGHESDFTESSKLGLSGDDGVNLTKLKLTFRSKGARRDDSTDSYEELASSELSAVPSDDILVEGQARLNSRYQLRQPPTSFDRHQTRVRTRASRSRQQFEGETGDEEASSGDESSSPDSDVLLRSRKRKRAASSVESQLMTGRTAYDKASKATRRSERSTRNLNKMMEIDIDQIERSDSEPTAGIAPRPIGAREAFQPLPRDNTFRARHCEQCETCGKTDNTSKTLIHCQGCSFAYHQTCIGPRSRRAHLVTKVGEGNFVLQCRRCVNHLRKNDRIAPDLARCQVCREPGPSCAPFRERKTMLQEQKDREANGGEDPIVNVDPSLINRAENVMIRCLGCWRAFHFHHLPSQSQFMDFGGQDDDERTKQHFIEYSQDWRCMDCKNAPGKISTIIAWRPVNHDIHTPDLRAEQVDEEEKEYLIKWEDFSYFRAQWKPGPWVWGIAAVRTRKSFFRKENGPKMRTEDAIPEEFLRIDIVFDIRYTHVIDLCTEEIDRARIHDVDQALIKYKGLGYEDAVWENVPTPTDGDRWTDFVMAYNDWVLGRYIHIPEAGPLKAQITRVRSLPFTKLEKKKQPDNVIGGELMKYQVDGLNWLYYRWYSMKNGILADEMGLGKTIQVISFLAMMVHDHNCYPFLIVVPNSTVANWRREIKQWTPELRVVTYFGSARARKMAYEYELYPEHSHDLRCHVVITSYEAVVDESCRRFFKGVCWQGLIVDEGQRLKNDRSIVHTALNALNVQYRILLTGTPLQNNARELFNLLQFINDDFDAIAMEREYAEMTNEKIAKLHDLIRPYILRRTKAQVLTFLPPMAQIIVPVSMSVLQKKLYKNIISKSPYLIRSLFSQNPRKPAERTSLNNILIQLRKCLCHPFIYSQDIEERGQTADVLHRNLVEASSKLQLLELMLPKLRERGHRVLIFSQFLDMLDIIEDFLTGLEMSYQRLDGQVGALEKQRRIDEFNAQDSPVFAFLLSTRAGGVGINLATADTVIIMDPDFNPHQDIQALSRAHRIGQTKKVLCFQLMTRDSAEEKIVQIGHKKMALDHVVVEHLDTEDLEEKDVASILRHGTTGLFTDNNGEEEIKYDSASIDKLLDRSQIENTKISEDNSVESQFSFARVWANDQAILEDSLNVSEEEQAPDSTVWDEIIKAREMAAAMEAAAHAEAFGRGRRTRMVVNYGLAESGGKADDEVDPLQSTPEVSTKRRRKFAADSDTDFKESDDIKNESSVEDANESDTSMNLADLQTNLNDATAKPKPQVVPFHRAIVRPAPVTSSDHNARKRNEKPHPSTRLCPACREMHTQGSCPLKVAGKEFCPLCGLAHYGYGRTCPNIRSETQVNAMIDTLKQSVEAKSLVDAASKYLRGVKGTLVQKRKQEEKEAEKPENSNANGVSDVGGLENSDSRIIAAPENEKVV